MGPGRPGMRRAVTAGPRFAARSDRGGARWVSGRGAAAARARAVVRAAPEELKFHDVDVDQAAADLSAGVILNTSSINFIPQGVTESNRLGRKCTVKSINWRGAIELASVAGAGLQIAQTWRMMLVLDKQCNGSVVTVTDVLESANYQSFNNLSNKGRFRTLSDKTFTLNPQAGAGDGAVDDTSPVRVDFTFFSKCNIPLEISSTGTPVIADIRSNNFFVLLISNSASAIMSLDSKVRLRFVG